MSIFSSVVFIALLSVLFLGWLYFPYRHIRYGGTVAPFWSAGKFAAIAVLLSMYCVMLFAGWKYPLDIWLSYGAMARRRFWPTWVAYGLPLWALAIILFPHVVRDLVAEPTPPLYLRPTSDPYTWFGWAMLGFAYVVLYFFNI